MKTQIKTTIAVIASFLSINIAAQAQTVNDKDLKKNIAPVTNSLSYIAKLEPLSYEFDNAKFKQLNLPAGQQFGFIADDVKQVLPNVVNSNSKWYAAGKNNQRTITTNQVDLEKLVPILVGAIKEQGAEIEKLRQEVNALKAKAK